MAKQPDIPDLALGADMQERLARMSEAQRLQRAAATVLKPEPGSYVMRVEVHVLERDGEAVVNLTSSTLMEVPVDDSGVPIHAPIEHSEGHEGPATGEDFDHWACWCGDEKCDLFWRLG